jgi:hypothetical protein
MEELGNIDSLVTEVDVEILFQAILRRPVNNDEYKTDMVKQGKTLRQLVLQLRGSEELKARMRRDLATADSDNRKKLGAPSCFRSPETLAVSSLPIKRMLIVGSCLSEIWAGMTPRLQPACESELYLFGRDLPETPTRPISEYDFQIVQLPLRFVLPDASFARLSQLDSAGHKALFAHATDGMRMLLNRAMRWNQEHGILTFVFPFIVPQQNFVGRLMPRYDLRNPVYFIEKLNEALATELQTYANAYFFDFNEITATYGRRYVQEDMIMAFNHGSLLGNFASVHDKNRLEPMAKATDVYEERIFEGLQATWQELMSMYRSIRQNRHRQDGRDRPR